MAPGSAVTATARFKLLSLASFGLISGACFFVGYYLLRRYRKTWFHRTDTSSEEKPATKPDDTSKADEVFDLSDNKEVAYKPSEEKRTEKQEETVPAKQANTSTQHESASGTAEHSSSKAVLRQDVAESSLLDSSRATIAGAGLPTENQLPTETTAENESSREKKEATAAETTGQESGSLPRHVITTKGVQATRNEAKLSPEEELKSETFKVTQAEKAVAQKLSGSEGKHTKTAKADNESRSETIHFTKTAEATKEDEQHPAAIKCVKTKDVTAGKQPKSETVLEIKPAETTVQKPSSSNRNDTKTAIETGGKEPIGETKKYASTSEAYSEHEQQSAKLKSIKATELPAEKQPMLEKNRDATIAETTPTDEVRPGRKGAKSPESAADKERKWELPRSTKSHIPEPIKRLADSRPESSKESATARKSEAEVPVVSPSKEEASTEQPGLKESKHNEGRLVKPPLNRDLAKTSESFQPQKTQLIDAKAQEPPFIDENKDDQSSETNTFVAKKIDSSTDAVASSPHHSSGQNVSATDEHVTESDDPSTLIVRSSKSLLPPPPLTPPPDTNKQSRRPRDRGTQGPQKVITPAEPASEGMALENQSSRTRHRWPPLEDKNPDKVEVDTGSQQALWKTNKKKLDSAQTSAQSPWASPHAVQDETTTSQSRRNIEFDDNFVEPVSTKVHTPTEKSEAVVPSDVTKESTLLNATPDCVLERKPLISEDDDDEDNDDEGVKKQFVSKNSTKNGNEVTTEPTRESNSSEATIKLVEIHQNCIGSLIGLTGEEVDRDVRLASLRALVNQSWAQEKHLEYTPIIDQLYANIDSEDASLRLESLRVLVNLSKNPAMVPHLLAAKAPSCLLKLLVPEVSEDILVNWLTILDDILWTSKEMCLTYAALPMEHRAASPETIYTGLYGLKNSRVLKSRIFVLSRHKSQQVTYLASRIYSCLTS